MDLIESLSEFGLTRQEAQLYLILYTSSGLTGYEVAKTAGISRSNAYTALASLVEKGAARLIEGVSSKFAAVAVDEFCKNKIRHLEYFKSVLSRNMPEIVDEQDGYMTVKGEQHIIDQMITMLEQTTSRVYLSLSGRPLQLVEPYLKDLIAKEIKVVLITNPPYLLEGAILYYSQKENSQIRIIVDSKTVLTGDLDNKDQSSCLYSRKTNLVDLFKESLKNEILLIEMTRQQVK